VDDQTSNQSNQKAKPLKKGKKEKKISGSWTVEFQY
jgi:hypothetical protein